MDVNILRIILVVLGAGLVLGIYLWERRKRSDARIHAVRREHESRLEPTMGSAAPEQESDSEAEGGLDHELQELQELVREERPVKQRKEPAPAKLGDSRQQDLFADDATTDADHYKHKGNEIPSLILQINVVARDDGFEGLDIIRAIQGEQLELGEMAIFHRHNEGKSKGPVLYSMASMVNPGTFPKDAMEEFKTPGLTLFAQLPGPRDGLEIFSEMHSTAEHLATELYGELQDETHSRLTKQTVEHIRSQIQEHRRRVQLAKSKLK